MSFTTRLIDYVETMCSDYTKMIVNKIFNSKHKHSTIKINTYLSEGTLLRPLNSFKIHINKTLYSFERSHVLLVYKICSKYESYDLPSFGDDYTPKILFIYFEHQPGVSTRMIEEHLLSETRSSLLREVIPTITMGSLLTIINSCETIGRINMYDE